MDNWFDYINFGFSIGGLIIAVLGLITSFTTTYMENKIRNYFKLFFTILSIYLLSNLLDQLSLYLSVISSPTISRIFLFLESYSAIFLMIWITNYLLDSSGKAAKKSYIFILALLLILIYTVLLIFAQFNDYIYYISKDNVYHRGEYYPTLLIPPALLMALNIFTLIRHRNSLEKKKRVAMSLYLIIPLVCMIFQMFFYGLLLIAIGTSVASFALFIYILNEQMELYVEQREEITKAKQSIIMLQMRPHFIYNTMTSIYYLCENNPQKAMSTINDFTTYLRRNFSAMSSTDTIPFKEELEHVKAYLSVEQSRFEDSLSVEFDTPEIDFRIPSLTLQPIVENSVKYGVDPELDPLLIKISTEKTKDGYFITVLDSGPGIDEYNPIPDDNREPHIALKNIRERLSIMCNGTITLKQRKEGGTEAVIFIPFK